MGQVTICVMYRPTSWDLVKITQAAPRKAFIPWLVARVCSCRSTKGELVDEDRPRGQAFETNPFSL